MANQMVGESNNAHAESMHALKYLTGYPEQVKTQVRHLIREGRLGDMLLQKYPATHDIRTDKALYDYVAELKNRFLRNAVPLSKVAFDSRINVVRNALGLHTAISRVQGNKLKARHEIRIASLFRETPPEFLKMIVVHELAHLKEREHNKPFYALCDHMLPGYHQIEFDTRLYLTWRALGPTAA